MTETLICRKHTFSSGNIYSSYDIIITIYVIFSSLLHVLVIYECVFLTRIQPGSPGLVDWLCHWIWPWVEPHMRTVYSLQWQCPTTPGSHCCSMSCHSSGTGLYPSNHLHYLKANQSAVLKQTLWEVNDKYKKLYNIQLENMLLTGN